MLVFDQIVLCFSVPSTCCPTGGIWSEWATSETCGDTCGSCAQLTYTRECLSDASTCPCTGSSSVIRNCATNVCYYPRLSCCAPYKSMVVNSTFACGPQPVEPAGPVYSNYCCQQSGFWAPWGAWSDCTGGTCGTCGTSTRNRTCYSSKWGCACQGNTTESMACRTVGTWSEWTVVTACPAAGQACGSCNMQQLTRTCSSATCPCFGDSTVYRICNPAPCTTNGTVVTNATCCSPYTLQDPNGNNLTTCGPVPAPSPSPSPMTCGGNASCCAIGGVWSEWSAGGTCSDTCGNCGATTKTRFCTSLDYGCPCSGPTTKQAECGSAVCLYPRDSCCGSRLKIVDTASNTFVCSSADDTDPPPSSLCWTCCPASGGYWSEWSGGTGCTDTCGSCGNTTQTRQCLTTAQNCSCIGASTRTINCNIGVCYYPRLSCCTPYASMVDNSSFICGPQPNYTTTYAPYDENCTLPPATCCQPGGSWSEWTADRQCTDYCGACGNVTYSRTCLSASSGCPCTGATNYSTQCNTGVCYYPRLSCCPGYSAMLINGSTQCGVTPAAPTDVAVSQSPGCPNCCPTYGIWSEWVTTTPCNDTCGSCGTSVIQRTCLSDSYGCPCTGVNTFNQVCGTSVCLYPRASCCAPYTKKISGSQFICGTVATPTNQIAQTTCCPPSGLGLWSSWTVWTTCSATCGLCGTQTRSRVCSSAKVGCPCVGNSTQTQSCGQGTCTGGTPCCAGKTQAVGYDGATFCTDQPLPACTGTWTDWMTNTGAVCNDTCGNCGVIAQSRYCWPSGCTCSGAYQAMNPCGSTVCLYPRTSCCAPYVKKIVGGKFVCA